jgi:parallel beta-helix repeat protein
MMKKQLILLLTFAMGLSTVQGAILDQAQMLSDRYMLIFQYVLHAQILHAQTFTAGISGQLDHIDLNIRVKGGAGVPGYPTTVSIVNVVGDVPSGSTIATVDSVIFYEGWNSVDFLPQSVFLTAGTMYGIVLSNDDIIIRDDGTVGWYIKWSGNLYPGGAKWRGDSIKGWYSEPFGEPPDVDGCFRTYFDVPLFCFAGLDQTYNTIPELITLDGRGSYDPNGYPLTYHWRQIEGASVELSDANAIEPTFVPTEFGVYAFELVVNNGLGDSEPDIVGIVITAENHAPIADAGLPRYAAQRPVVLDGTGSYDPDGYGVAAYHWQQTSGPNVTITDADTATPTISGFTQTDNIQECEFELVVGDSELTSQGDTVKIKIVPAMINQDKLMRLENAVFNCDKPTVIYFGGGNCVVGGGYWGIWHEMANVISFPFYSPDDDTGPRTYEQCGDMVIEYLSRVAPNYNQLIQTMGFSTGGLPATDTAIRLNETYADPRYAVNRVTHLDAACRDYTVALNTYLRNPVAGEQCWIENYNATYIYKYYAGTLNITFPGGDHGTPIMWVYNSLYNSSMHNGGVNAGFYYSVAGPGKNLQLAADSSNYYFEWVKSDPDYLVVHEEPSYPGRLPEPVTLIGPADGDTIDANGAVFSCEESENAVTYQLLVGREPYRVMDYYAISESSTVPNKLITALPLEKTWWTIKAYDQYGSTIYADPVCVNARNLMPLSIENITIGKKYPLIQIAINEAENGHEIVVQPGTYYESIDFQGKNITLKSIYQSEPNAVASTILAGFSKGSVVTFSGGEDANCVLAGFTISGDNDGGILYTGGSPTICDCIISKNTGAGVHYQGLDTNSYWNFNENSGTVAYDSVGDNHGTVYGAQWMSGQVDGALSFDGIDDYVDCGNVMAGFGNFSICLWLKTTQIANTSNRYDDPVIIGIKPIIGMEPSFIAFNDFGLINYRGKLAWLDELATKQFRDYFDTGVMIADGLWHHIGVIRSSLSIDFYVDGKNVGNKPAGSDSVRDDMLEIGRAHDEDSSLYFEGIIDEVSIYKKSLSAKEIQRIYLEGLEVKGPSITNCVIVENEGAGIELWQDSNATITNCTIAGNQAEGIYCTGNKPIVRNSIVWGNKGSEIDGFAGVTYSDIQGGCPGQGNIVIDPCFADRCSGNYNLLPASPCIDAGNNTAVPAGVTTDLDGNPRFVDQPEVPDTGNGTAPIVDMGAYEANYIEVPMKFTPQALNPRSKGKWVKAHFVLPEEFVAEDVDANTPAVIPLLGIQSEYMNVFINGDGLVEIEAAFTRAEFCGAATGNEPLEVTVIGLLTTGQQFYGTDIIKITNRAFEHLAILVSHWLEGNCFEPDWCGGADLNADSVVNFIDFALLDR